MTAHSMKGWPAGSRCRGDRRARFRLNWGKHTNLTELPRNTARSLCRWAALKNKSVHLAHHMWGACITGRRLHHTKADTAEGENRLPLQQVDISGLTLGWIRQPIEFAAGDRLDRVRDIKWHPTAAQTGGREFHSRISSTGAQLVKASTIETASIEKNTERWVVPFTAVEGNLPGRDALLFCAKPRTSRRIMRS
ncbi:unnamed protein product [Trypanosoma congolense IL3000]|uniref:WGS project CAEQ00000000 data, annotated contig 36 n=1 Tax=Trypanosoma congolense (strain IL3000) TaxID=1068625 RepID=F9WFA5_TRYCI|nr:unnamed protein product [Trypanosoma congolense IL3000]